MTSIKKEDILLVSKHSDLPSKSVQRSIEEHCYAQEKDWRKLLSYLLLVLGVGFFTTGILFFFAYNWADLHKFAKIGITETLLIATTILCLFYFQKPIIRSIILTAACVLVGVLFAVFGQIYQTGANAYDFFLAWTLFISIWVAVGRFAPLTLLYIILINTTAILYSNQVAKDWSYFWIYILLFSINAVFSIVTLYLKEKKTLATPTWFTHILSLSSFTIISILMIYEILDPTIPYLYIALILNLLSITAALWFAQQSKSTFYIALAAFSAISSICSFILKSGDFEAGTLLFLSIFIIISVSLTIKFLIQTQKKWNHDQQR